MEDKEAYPFLNEETCQFLNDVNPMQKWIGNDATFTVCAEYDDREYGSYFKDDTPEDRLSVRPGAAAKAYRITNERNIRFFSPEETLLYLTAKCPNGFALVLQDMNNAESAKFEKLWAQMHHDGKNA